MPHAVLDHLRDRYVAGVANAEAMYESHSADEDTVTGALGQAIAMPQPIVVSIGETEYLVRISYRKIRGRGPKAPEKRYGADGIFQISVIDRDGRMVREKGLPFQSKKGWRGKNSSLLSQAIDMKQELHGGLVVDFTEKGYRACPVEAVIEAKGSRQQVDRFGLMRPLGQILSHEFLDCTIGIQGLYFDPRREEFVHGDEMGQHLITTEVQIKGEGAI